MKLGKMLLLMLLLAIGKVAYADCQSAGKTYPEGKVIGPYICQDGKWVRR